MSSKAPEFDAIKQREYRSRTLQFLSGLPFPATKDQILAFYMRKNTPMELMEDTMAIEARSFATAAEFANAITAIHAARTPHSWTSREVRD
ncbi:MAG TPA: DUF2795 domain-containing protein [Thermomicrobiales bacterium]|jgi:hypothetical protein